MAIQELATTAKEESVYVIPVSWLDEDGEAVTPSAATWTLTDMDGNIINSRSAVTITGLSTSNTVVLQGDDLAITGTGRKREIRFTYTYTSSLGTLTANVPAHFWIDDAVSL